MIFPVITFGAGALIGYFFRPTDTARRRQDRMANKRICSSCGRVKPNDQTITTKPSQVVCTECIEQGKWTP